MDFFIYDEKLDCVSKIDHSTVYLRSENKFSNYDPTCVIDDRTLDCHEQTSEYLRSELGLSICNIQWIVCLRSDSLAIPTRLVGLFVIIGSVTSPGLWIVTGGDGKKMTEICLVQAARMDRIIVISCRRHLSWLTTRHIFYICRRRS